MKALVLGGQGKLGRELARLAGPGSGISHAAVSVSDAAAVDALLARHGPAVVFNCAAYDAVDTAEAEPEEAFRTNSDGAFNAAVACVRHGARLVHFSTNYVFDGSAGPYVETDRPAPHGVYARSKLDGESRVLAAQPEALVIRTAALFGGDSGSSFPERIVHRARRSRQVQVVDDQSVNPTYTVDLAESAFELAGQGLRGIVHLVSRDCCTWYEFARAVLKEFGISAVLEPVSTAALKPAASRPLHGCLESNRVPLLRSWKDGLREWAERIGAAGTP